jgi:hypothetical protein
LIAQNRPSPGTKLDCEIAAGHGNVVGCSWATAGTVHPIFRIAILEKQVMMWIEDDEDGRKGLYSRNGR